MVEINNGNPPVDQSVILDPLLSTRVGLHLEHMRERVENMGEIVRFADGDTLCLSGTRERVLYVIHDGEVDYGAGWLAAGAHFGELGFLLDLARTATVRSKGPVTCWKINADRMMIDPEAAFYLASALIRELPRRLRKFNPGPEPGVQPCDYDHPAISSLALVLKSADEIQTARAIWGFVRAMPYRFGPWWEKASNTLKSGSGMCTTKANLQVALMRAAGLDAGFVELKGGASLILPVIPEKWRHRVKPEIRHYMAAVRIDGEWHVADASFTDAVLFKFATEFPVIHTMLPFRLEKGTPFHPAAMMSGISVTPQEIFSELSLAMARRSSFDLDQFELLNLENDLLQGTVQDEPSTLIRAWRFLPENPTLALHTALGAAAVLASELYSRITTDYEPL